MKADGWEACCCEAFTHTHTLTKWKAFKNWFVMYIVYTMKKLKENNNLCVVFSFCCLVGDSTWSNAINCMVFNCQNRIHTIYKFNSHLFNKNCRELFILRPEQKRNEWKNERKSFTFFLMHTWAIFQLGLSSGATALKWR